MNTRANWILFNKVICDAQVPIIAVVTGLEEEANLDDWWRRKENKDVFRRYNMKPKAVGCIVSVRLYADVFEPGICFFAWRSKEFTAIMRSAFDEFVEEVGMGEDDSVRLKRSLLKAEKIIEKGTKKKHRQRTKQ